MNMTAHRCRTGQRYASVFFGVTVLLAAADVDARGLDDIRVSKVGDQATIEIELGCAMRYTNHTSADSGAEVRVQMRTGQDCRLALRDTWNEIRRPVGSRMANLIEVEFDRGNNDAATITWHFATAVGFKIQQPTNL